MKQAVIATAITFLVATMLVFFCSSKPADEPMGTPNPPPRVTPSVTVVPPLYSMPIEGE